MESTYNAGMTSQLDILCHKVKSAGSIMGHIFLAPWAKEFLNIRKSCQSYCMFYKD